MNASQPNADSRKENHRPVAIDGPPGCGVAIGGVDADPYGEVVTEPVQVLVELPHVFADVAPVQIAVGRHRAAQQQHGAVVHSVEHIAAVDLVPDLGQPGVGSTGLIDCG